MPNHRFSFCLVRTLVVTALLSLSMAGCTVGPNYKKPKPEMPTQWSEAVEPVEVPGAPGIVDITRWWTLFNDEKLTSLVERAVQFNKDLQIAGARLREARAQRVVVASSAYPTVGTSNAYTRSRDSENASSTPGLVTDFFQVGFDASWEIDVFGGIRRSIEAADADVAAAVESRRDVLVSLLAEVARAYLDVRGNQYRLRIARDNIVTQQKTLELTVARFEAGLSSELNVAQARAQLANTETQVPLLESQIRRGIYEVGVLLGQRPEDVVDELMVEAPVPPIPPQVPVGLPSELLRRRPDIRQCEKQLAAATARIGVATAQLFPSFSLTGNLGMASLDVTNVLSYGSRTYSIGPTITWPIFDAGKIRAGIKVQNARQEAALALYEKTVLTALSDVESSLIAYVKEQERNRSLVVAVNANQRAFDIGDELYSKGLVDFLNVLDSQRALYVSQDALAQSTATITTDLVALFKSLGGGWAVPVTE
jgi:outer membrane protein, multidrug efflux system